MKPAVVFTLTLKPEPPARDHLGRDPEYRLRLFLKRVLRDFGLRCVGVRTEIADAPAAESSIDT